MFRIFIFAMVAIATGGLASAETRLALIIANKDYTAKVGPLANPHKDAALMERALKRHKFSVRIVRDPRRSALLREVDRYAGDLAAAGDDAVGFFYYSGHGAADPTSRRNYLIPVDAPDAGSPDLWYDSVSLDRVREVLKNRAPKAAHIVVFDACRSELRLGRGGKGYEPVGFVGGMLTAFSASPDQIASDGAPEDAAGPYARALSAALDETLDDRRFRSASSLFDAVRRRITGAPSLTQEPIYTSGLDRDVVFGDAAASIAPTTSTAAPSPLDRETLAQAAFDRVKGAGDPRRLELVAEQFPDTFAGKLAALEAEELRAAVEAPPSETQSSEFPSEDDYRAAQSDLKRLGYYASPVDGDWGPGSQQALASFQNDFGLRDSGGDLTEAAYAALKVAERRAAKDQSLADEELRRMEAQQAAEQEALSIASLEAEDQQRREAEVFRRERATRWEELRATQDVAAFAAFSTDLSMPFAMEARARLVELYEEAQSQLAQLGLYAVRIDGEWGPNSRRALVAFQQERGDLPADGKLTSTLLDALRVAVDETKARATTDRENRSVESELVLEGEEASPETNADIDAKVLHGPSLDPEIAAWAKVSLSRDPEELIRYAEQYPTSPFASVATQNAKRYSRAASASQGGAEKISSIQGDWIAEGDDWRIELTIDGSDVSARVNPPSSLHLFDELKFSGDINENLWINASIRNGRFSRGYWNARLRGRFPVITLYPRSDAGGPGISYAKLRRPDNQ